MTELLSSRPEVRLLSQEVIHRIAAGEVVDRPASVLKELIENALDAGTTRLRVSLVDGGLKLIEVEDNGWGMSKADLQVCLQRHATSKIHDLEDLESILTLGFRGEALSAISSVSRLQLESVREGFEAWNLEVVGGIKSDIKPSAIRLGTKISVHDLFFNIPARKKFLKQASREGRECLEVLESQTLLNPHVAFQWSLVSAAGELKEQRQLPQQSWLDRFMEIAKGSGAEAFQVRESAEGGKLPVGIKFVEIIGLKPPQAARHQRSIWLSVNGRYVVDKRLPYALREALAGLIEIGQFPICALRLEVDPSQIDVNIHPQKKEIRWPDGFSLGGLAYGLVRPVFSLKQAPPESAMQAPSQSVSLTETAAFASEKSESLFSYPQAARSPGSYLISPELRKEFLAPKLSPTPSFNFSELRAVGQIGAAWLVCESSQGLVLIDQHAAHERVQFEKIYSRHVEPSSKALLLPLRIKLPMGVENDDAILIQTLLDLGFELSDPEFVPATFIEFVALPDIPRAIDWQVELETLFDRLAHEGDVNGFKESLATRIAASLACHGSVRRGQRLGLDQIKELLQSLAQLNWSLCPHGRPFWYELTNARIEDLFHR